MPKNISTEWGPNRVVVVDDNNNNSSINIELAIHSVGSIPYIRELQTIFPAWAIADHATVVSTMQNAAIDLVGIGQPLEAEKDNLLEKFVVVAKKICTVLEEASFRADFIDPCSGLPGTYLDGNTVFNEVQSAQMLLGYKMMNVGCCKVILHPEWGSAVYPASIVTLAPPETVINAIESICTRCT